MYLDKVAEKDSTFVVTASFTDENGNAVTPTSINWSLYNTSGDVKNSREDVSIDTPASSVNIYLSANDLSLDDDETSVMTERILRIEAEYISAEDSNTYPIVDEFSFFIQNKVGS